MDLATLLVPRLLSPGKARSSIPRVCRRLLGFLCSVPMLSATGLGTGTEASQSTSSGAPAGEAEGRAPRGRALPVDEVQRPHGCV